MWYEFEGEFFFSFIPREKHSKYEKTIFYPDIGEKNFFFWSNMGKNNAPII